MKLKRNSLLGFIIAVALALSSCNRQTIYSHYEPVDIDGWERSDTLWFYAGGLTEGCYNEQVGLRINGNYPFKDLSLVVEQRLLSTHKPSSNAIHSTWPSQTMTAFSKAKD